jgi:hypothetical protein
MTLLQGTSAAFISVIFAENASTIFTIIQENAVSPQKDYNFEYNLKLIVYLIQLRLGF